MIEDTSKYTKTQKKIRFFFSNFHYFAWRVPLKEMAFLHAHSCECIISELELFDSPPTQTTIENSQWTYYKIFSSLTDSALIKVVVPGHGNDYLDFPLHF